MPTSVLAAIGFLVAAIVLVVVGMTPLLFVPVFLIAGALVLIPLWAVLGHTTTFRRDTGAPATRDASYDPVQRP
jgi:hypothetical protein